MEFLEFLGFFRKYFQTFEIFGSGLELLSFVWVVIFWDLGVPNLTQISGFFFGTNV
jgi:hypothetical protein